MNRRVHVYIVVAAILFLPALVHWSDDPAAAPTPIDTLDIVFEKPLNGQTVDQFTDVKYELRGVMPPGHRAVLLVRDPLGQFWSWDTSPTREYRRVQIGQAIVDRSRTFEIGIVITDVEVPFGQPTQVRPKGILYRSVIVTRR